MYFLLVLNFDKINEALSGTAEKIEKLGAGEILLTSMDRDGTKKGYDLDLTKKVSNLVNIPVIASGGVGVKTQTPSVEFEVTGRAKVSGNTEIGGLLTGTGNVAFSGANVTLGTVANLHIAGGSNGQYLQTDGAGNLSWSTVAGGASSNISNGNSNVSIATANGNITMSAVGNANIVTITGTGANIFGTLNTTGNVTFTGANISLGNVGNVKITGGTANYVLTTDGAGNLDWVAQSGGNAANVTVDNFTGNGVQTVFTLSTTPIGINQTSVNYNGATVLRTDYTLANANITFSSAPANGSYIEVTTINLTTSGGGGGTSGANYCGGGGARGLSVLVPKFFDEAFDRFAEQLKKLNLKNGDIIPASKIKDVFVEIPDDEVDTIIRGTSEIGGPIDYMYVGPLDVESSVEGNKLVLNGEFIAVEDYIKKVGKFYLRFRKRDLNAQKTVKIAMDIMDKDGRPRLFVNPDNDAACLRVVVTDVPSENAWIFH